MRIVSLEILIYWFILLSVKKTLLLPIDDQGANREEGGQKKTKDRLKKKPDYERIAQP